MAVVALLMASVASRAQGTVEASIDSVQLWMGEQTRLTVKAIVKEGSQVEFPSFEPMQQLTEGVEVLEQQDGEKPSKEDGFVEKTRTYTITSFDGKLYYLPPLTVKVNGKPMKTAQLALKVLEVEVDTVNIDKFFPPKDVQDNPFLWQDWKLPFWLSLVAILFIAAAVYLFIRLKQGKPVVINFKAIKKLLPHQKAMKEIELIKEDKMTASENSKEYYTRLTETLRRYIEERYGFNAMEMTSAEIIDKLMNSVDSQGVEELKELFETADLVKFAKYSTLINENDKNLLAAIDFINATKIEKQPEEDKKPKLTEEQKKDIKERNYLKMSVIALGGIALVLLIAVCVMVARIML